MERSDVVAFRHTVSRKPEFSCSRRNGRKPDVGALTQNMVQDTTANYHSGVEMGEALDVGIDTAVTGTLIL